MAKVKRLLREIIDTKKLEACAIFDGADTNPLIRLIVNMVKNKAPNVVHKCPYTVWNVHKKLYT